MMNEGSVFSGKIGEVVHTTQPDGRVFERYRRPPGVRLVIVSPAGELLLTEEYRTETKQVDLRLPGGKVCDTLDDYRRLLGSGTDLLEAAKAAAIAEARQETGLIIRDPKLLTKANAGATVEWDLYYFLVRDYEEHPLGQDLELGEDISVTWLKPSEIRTAVLASQMHEWRSVGVLFGLVFPKMEE